MFRDIAKISFGMGIYVCYSRRLDLESTDIESIWLEIQIKNCTQFEFKELERTQNEAARVDTGVTRHVSVFTSY